MKIKDYKEKLKNRARETNVPNVLDDIEHADFLAYRTGDTSIIPQSTAQQRRLPKRKFLAFTASVAAVMTFIFIFVFVILPATDKFDNTIYATASVNISGIANYSVDLNQNSQVVEITVDNQAGVAVLQNISYKQKKFDSVLTALLTACIDYWDLTEEQLSSNAITFSVNCHDSDKSVSLENNWNNSMSAAKQHCRNKQDNGHGNSHH